MKKPDNVSIGDIYGTMLNSLKKNLHESIKPGGNDLTDKDPLPLEDGGPNEKSGYNKALNDEDFKDEDEEDDVSKYVPKWKKTTEDLHNKSKDPKTDDKTKKKLKDVVDMRTATEAEEDEDEENERDDDYSKEEWEDKFRKDKSGKWSEKEIDSAVKKENNEEDEEIEESKKSSIKILNKFMSNKSLFDKMYSRVLRENFGQEDEGNDIDALGLDDATPDSDLDDGFGDEDLGGEEDSVTFTLDRATAQALCDVLQGALGGEEEGLEGEGDDLDFEGEGDSLGDEGGEYNFDEDEEVQGTKVAPDKKSAFQAKSNKVGGKVVPHKTKASSDVTDDVGDDGDYGHAITSPKKPNMGTDNKVASSIKGKGQEFFR